MPYSKDNTKQSLAAVMIILAMVTVLLGGLFLLAYSTVVQGREEPAPDAVVTTPASPED